MAGARRSSAGKRGRMPGWAILLLGLTLGIAGVLVMQLVIGRSGSTDGLAALFKPSAKPTPAETTKRPEPTPAKPKLDFYTVLPEVETVLPERTSKTKSARTERPEEGVSFILQAGAFASFDDADQLKAKLALQGLQAQIQRVSIEGKGDFHRVRLGPYENVNELDRTHRQLTEMGIKPIRLRVKKGTG